MRPVVLLTDFGLADHYVGVLHAALDREAPEARRIDLGHQVPAGDAWAASFLLRSSWPYLPDGAVVLAVVDPGVGSERLPGAARIGGRWIVGPDNGVLTAVGLPDEVWRLDWERMGLSRPSSTFHGRDLFAPAAARLARGDHAEALGEAVDPGDLAPCPLPEPEPVAGGMRATVLHVDRFGNVVTNLAADRAPVDALGWYGAPRAARRVATYAEGRYGEVVLLAGSSGLLELAVNRDSASEVTGLGRGDSVDIVWGG